jgi:hypothetical protein
VLVLSILQVKWWCFLPPVRVSLGKPYFRNLGKVRASLLMIQIGRIISDNYAMDHMPCIPH